MSDEVKEFPITRGCAKVKIESKKVSLLILALCIIPPLFTWLFMPNQFPNWLAAIIFIPMTISMVLLPFTGWVRKIIYAIPTTILLLLVFWPLTVYYVIKKMSNPGVEVWKQGIVAWVPWILEVIADWMLVGVGAMMTVFFIVGIFIKG